MTPRARHLSIGLLLAAAAAAGLLSGRNRDGSESAAVERVAERHLRQGGSGACAGRPGAEAWLVVTCGRGADRRVYRVEEGGRIARTAGGGA